MPIKGQAVSGGSLAYLRSEIQNAFRDRVRREREPDQARRPDAAVEILVPFVPERLVWKKRHACREVCHARIAPEAERAHRHGDLDLAAAAVDGPDLAGERVFRAAAVAGRAESRVAPRAGRNRVRTGVQWIQRRVVD